MKKVCLSFLILFTGLLSNPVFSQKDSSAVKDSTLLGLPGDNLDLYATLDLFQKSKTIEEFEKNLNLEKTGINNLDLNLDKKVDFIKVVTKKNGDDFTFVLQVDVAKSETQDVAVILVSKDKDKKITMQIVGDKDLYGKDYIVELKESKTPPVTPNPGYTGTDTTIVVAAPSKTTVVVVEQAPIVQYVYSPAYVPYAPPYYYGYYPPYFAAFTVMAVGMYWGSHAHYHGGYYGGHGHYHGNTTVIHNTNNFNNYNSNRNTSNTVNHNRQNGNYNRANNASGATRPSTGASGGARPSTQPSRPSGGSVAAGGARPSTQPSGGSGGARPSTQPSGGGSFGNASGSGGARPSTQPSTGGGSSRPSTSNSMSSPSNRSSSGSSRGSGGYSSGGSSRSSGSYSGGGGSRSGGSSRGGGGSRGGGSRGGGGRR